MGGIVTDRAGRHAYHAVCVDGSAVLRSLVAGKSAILDGKRATGINATATLPVDRHVTGDVIVYGAAGHCKNSIVPVRYATSF